MGQRGKEWWRYFYTAVAKKNRAPVYFVPKVCEGIGQIPVLHTMFFEKSSQSSAAFSD